MKKLVFTGAGVAIVTPMKDDLSVDYEQLGALLDFQLAGGTDAVVVCGTTGEASTLSDEEHTALIRFTVDRVKGRVPVVAGVGSNDTQYAVWLSREAEAAGADALLHVSPYYNKTSQAGLVRHFFTVADAANLPVVLYNVPSRTGLNIQPETYLKLSEHPNIVATKEAGGNISEIARTINLCGENLAIYSGNDDQIVPLMSLGAKGVVSVLSNVMPRETHDICRLYFENKPAESAALQLRLLDLINALFSDVNPVPVKAALNLMGFHVGECRLPLAPMSDSGLASLKDAMRAQGILGILKDRG
jgi:4-hydroxy-tetrahydrodipicolinate synthase